MVDLKKKKRRRSLGAFQSTSSACMRFPVVDLISHSSHTFSKVRLKCVSENTIHREGCTLFADVSLQNYKKNLVVSCILPKMIDQLNLLLFQIFLKIQMANSCQIFSVLFFFKFGFCLCRSSLSAPTAAAVQDSGTFKAPLSRAGLMFCVERRLCP